MGSELDVIAELVMAREAQFKRGLAGCLAADPGSEVVGCAGAAREGSHPAAELPPDVALVGTALPDAPSLGTPCPTERSLR